MSRQVWFSAIALLMFAGWPAPAQALVILGQLEPGEIELFADWDQTTPFRKWLELKRHAGGHFTDAPTWWDGHFRAEYYFQGKEAELQRLIDAIDQSQVPHVKILVLEGEGFWDGYRVNLTDQSLSYDWSVSLAETRSRKAVKQDPAAAERFNVPHVQLTIFLSDRLQRERLQIPPRLLANPPTVVLVDATAEPAPADALHAIARLRRSFSSRELCVARSPPSCPARSPAWILSWSSTGGTCIPA